MSRDWFSDLRGGELAAMRLSYDAIAVNGMMFRRNVVCLNSEYDRTLTNACKMAIHCAHNFMIKSRCCPDYFPDVVMLCSDMAESMLVKEKIISLHTPDVIGARQVWVKNHQNVKVVIQFAHTLNVSPFHHFVIVNVNNVNNLSSLTAEPSVTFLSHWWLDKIPRKWQVVAYDDKLCCDPLKFVMTKILEQIPGIDENIITGILKYL